MGRKKTVGREGANHSPLGIAHWLAHVATNLTQIDKSELVRSPLPTGPLHFVDRSRISKGGLRWSTPKLPRLSLQSRESAWAPGPSVDGCGVAQTRPTQSPPSELQSTTAST